MHPPSSESTFLATLEAAQLGDSGAMEVLFERFYGKVQAMVHAGLARDLRTNRPWLLARFSTGDVVQDVFRSLLKDLSGFQGSTEDAFTGYLAMVVRNRLIDAIRFHEAAQRDGRLSGDEVLLGQSESEESNPLEAAANAEALEGFHQALRTFDDREQLLLRARLEQEVSFQDLADQLGYGSRDAARRAFYGAQARLAIRLRKSMGGGTESCSTTDGEVGP